MNRAHLHPVSFALLLALGGCAASASDPEVAAPDTGLAVTAQSADEIRVREDGLTLWVDVVAPVSVEGSGELRATLRGRTSANLDAAFSYVPDDAFGTASVVGPRSFEVALRGGHEINSILSGLPLLTRLTMSNGKVYTARISLAPRFTAQEGSAAITLDTPIRTAYVRGADPLRYRGTAATAATGLTVTTTDGASPAVAALGGGRFRLDWAYAGLSQVFDRKSDRVQLAATSGGTAVSRRAGIELTAEGIGLTVRDPELVWPAPVCQKTVFDCIQAKPIGTLDLGSCGSYRDVARCMTADACDFTPAAPFSLTGKDATALAPAVKAAHDACPRTSGSWCSVGPAAAFTYPRCVARPPTQDEVNEAALAEDRGGRFDPSAGTALTRAQLLMTQALGGGLLTAIDAFAGDTDVRATVFESEVSCHNCHEWAIKYVLLYPRTRTVVVVDGTHGYDS